MSIEMLIMSVMGVINMLRQFFNTLVGMVFFRKKARSDLDSRKLFCPKGSHFGWQAYRYKFVQAMI